MGIGMFYVYYRFKQGIYNSLMAMEPAERQAWIAEYEAGKAEKEVVEAHDIPLEEWEF